MTVMIQDRVLTSGSQVRSHQSSHHRAPKSEERHRLSPLALGRAGVCIGVISGVAEVGVLLARHRLQLPITEDLLRLNRHFLWMTPVSTATILGVVGFLAGLFVAPLPSLASRVILAGLGFLGVLGPLWRMPLLRGHACLALALGSVAVAARCWPARWPRPFVGIAKLAGVVVLVGLLELDRRHVSQREQQAFAALPASKTGSPNVLMIVLDTVRARSLGLHGHVRDTSPNLERLAARGIYFDEAWSTAPWTLPSHVSLFTGLWPHQTTAGMQRRLPDEPIALAEILARNGYATGGIVGNTHFCNRVFGLDRGFATWIDFPENSRVSTRETLRGSTLGLWAERWFWAPIRGIAVDAPAPRNAETINQEALAWLDRLPPNRPFFLFLNYIDAHSPYKTPAHYVRPHGDEAALDAALDTVRRFGGRDKSRLGSVEKRKFLEATETLRDAYEDGISYLDEQLGCLLAELDRRGLTRDTLMVVTSDHGEQLGERLMVGHGIALYRPLLHVPLVMVPPVSYPTPRGTRVGSHVSIRDVAATVLLVTNTSPGALPGRSLSRFWDGTTGTPEPEIALAGIELSPLKPVPDAWIPALRGPMWSLVVDGHHYVVDGNGREELFHFPSDSNEERDLAPRAESAPILARARAVLRLVLGDSLPLPGARD